MLFEQLIVGSSILLASLPLFGQRTALTLERCLPLLVTAVIWVILARVAVKPLHDEPSLLVEGFPVAVLLVATVSRKIIRRDAPAAQYDGEATFRTVRMLALSASGYGFLCVLLRL